MDLEGPSEHIYHVEVRLLIMLTSGKQLSIWKLKKKKKRLLSDKELSQSPCTLLQERKRSTSFMKLYQTRHKKELTPKKRNKRLREEAGQCRSS